MWNGPAKASLLTLILRRANCLLIQQRFAAIQNPHCIHIELKLLLLLPQDLADSYPSVEVCLLWGNMNQITKELFRDQLLVSWATTDAHDQKPITAPNVSQRTCRAYESSYGMMLMAELSEGLGLSNAAVLVPVLGCNHTQQTHVDDVLLVTEAAHCHELLHARMVLINANGQIEYCSISSAPAGADGAMLTRWFC